jgi:hypothetical protein
MGRPISYVTGSRRWNTRNQKSGVTETLQHKGVDTVTDSFLSVYMEIENFNKADKPVTKKNMISISNSMNCSPTQLLGSGEPLRQSVTLETQQ